MLNDPKSKQTNVKTFGSENDVWMVPKKLQYFYKNTKLNGSKLQLSYCEHGDHERSTATKYENCTKH